MIDRYYDYFYNKLYTERSVVRFVNGVTGKTKTYTYKHNDYFKKCLVKNNGIKNINFYIEKYHFEDKINKLILDFDGDDNEVVFDEVKRLNETLKNKNINHYIVDSTNKGYHVYIDLDNDYDFTLHNEFKYNNEMFKKFVYEVIVGDYSCLDEVNVGLRTNIRMVGSIHPKTNKVVHIIYQFNNDVSCEDYISTCYDKSKNNVKEIKYGGYWKKVLCYDSKYIDLRNLPWGNVGHSDGDSLWVCCPWHNDDKPSLRVYEKSAYCMRCGKISFDKICDYFNINIGD